MCTCTVVVYCTVACISVQFVRIKYIIIILLLLLLALVEIYGKQIHVALYTHHGFTGLLLYAGTARIVFIDRVFGIVIRML